MSDHLRDQAAAFLKSRGTKDDDTSPADTPVETRTVRPLGLPATSSPKDPLNDGEPGQGTQPPKKRKRTTPSPKRAPSGPETKVGVPPPIYRTGEATERIALEAPVQFEPLRELAWEAGMNVSQLVLAVIAAERDQLLVDAKKAPILSARWPPGRKRWTLIVSPEELDELDRLVDELTQAFNQRSRTAVVLEVLRRWSSR